MVRPIEVTDENFSDIVNTDKIVMIDFWATWCGPCKMLAPIVENLAIDYDGRAIVGKLDVDMNPQVSNQFGIRSIPTVLFFRNGEVVDKVVGLVPKDKLERKLEDLV